MSSTEYSDEFLQCMMDDEPNECLYSYQQAVGTSSKIDTQLSILCIGQYCYKPDQPTQNGATCIDNANILPLKSSSLSCLSNKELQTLKSIVIRKNLFNETIWDSVHRQNAFWEKDERARISVELHEEVWIEACKESWSDDTLPIIPMKINDNNNDNSRLYVKIIRICRVNAYIGLGVEYITITNKLLYGFYARYCGDRIISDDVLGLIIKFYTICQVSCIHLDVDYIENQLSDPNSADIARFRPFISDLMISNDAGLQEDGPTK